MKQKIEAAIRETLVVENKQSIWRAVEKILLIVEQEQALRQANVSGSLPMVEIIGYLERLKHYLSSGSTYCFDNEHDLNDSEELEKFINSLRQ